MAKQTTTKEKKYTWEQIKQAIRIAYEDASEDSWNVPFLYEQMAIRKIRNILKRKK